ncbi:membrane protein [Murmansk poxvirus]|uniref:Membrane protein n=1 Tax=Murmansk poxvirus TaxID=2025359 RepID=A0A223FMQ9_9POXV|nr:membrane protein [Murmansk poxvirus]YP_009408472.1 Entry and Fusion IMV protein [NY_014 poxvirus]AST09283.1 membrane protein [Murmansk poxvirus]AST09485.1 Entry and Fusion IMV protein [NY_014 poxvirus]
MEKPHVCFNPVFIEPTFKHSLLTVYKHKLVIFFEVLVVFVLIYVFFKSEIITFFKSRDDIPNPVDKLRTATLVCEGNKLMINGLTRLGTERSALSLNSKPIVYKDCLKLLQTINGSRSISFNDVLRRR